MLDEPFFRGIQSPVTNQQLQPLSPKCECVQFAAPLTDQDHQKVAAWMQAYPKVRLRAYGHYYQLCNLQFLRHYQFLRKLTIDLFLLNSFDELSLLSPKLESLRLGPTKKKSHSLSFLPRFPNLRELSIAAHNKDIDAIGCLHRLEDLNLCSIKLPDLSILKSLRKLRSLQLKSTGIADLKLLPEIGRLQSLHLSMNRNLVDIGPVAAVPTLKSLILQSLSKVKAIPSLRTLPRLKRVWLIAMKGLLDLQPVSKAPALEQLIVVDMGQLEAEAFQPFVGHPKLQGASIALGSVRKNKAASGLLGLPAAHW